MKHGSPSDSAPKPPVPLAPSYPLRSAPVQRFHGPHARPRARQAVTKAAAGLKMSGRKIRVSFSPPPADWKPGAQTERPQNALPAA